METRDRSKEHQRNQGLEALLAELNTTLGQAEEGMEALPAELEHPVVLVVGAPRSGTTLLMQWLAATGDFAYPSNLLSRFYAAPYLGARIQQLLTDPRFDFKDELRGIATQEAPFASALGKTKGALQPNEFWYFWRRFIPNTVPEWLTREQEAAIDGAGLKRGFAHLQSAFGKPFAAKGLILQYNLETLRRILGKVIFVHNHRHPFFNMQSLLRSREAFFGNLDAWYSVKPREYAWLRDRDPVTQVAGQVHFTHASIEAELASMDQRHVLRISHEEFCRDPGGFHLALGAKLAEWGWPITTRYHGPANFAPHDHVTVDPAMEAAMLKAYEDVSGTALGPIRATD